MWLVAAIASNGGKPILKMAIRRGGTLPPADWPAVTTPPKRDADQGASA